MESRESLLRGKKEGDWRRGREGKGGGEVWKSGVSKEPDTRDSRRVLPGFWKDP